MNEIKDALAQTSFSLKQLEESLRELNELDVYGERYPDDTSKGEDRGASIKSTCGSKATVKKYSWQFLLR